MIIVVIKIEKHFRSSYTEYINFLSRSFQTLMISHYSSKMTYISMLEIMLRILCFDSFYEESWNCRILGWIFSSVRRQFNGWLKRQIRRLGATKAYIEREERQRTSK